jgi:hypothetical protein
VLARVWRQHQLAIILIGVFLAQSIAYWFVHHGEWVEDARAHGDSATTLGYVQHYASEMLVSVLADTYGALLVVVFFGLFRDKWKSRG